MRLMCLILIVCTLLAHSSVAADAVRLNDLLRVPDWLTIKGETRARLEGVDGQFRAGGSGNDQLLLFRSILSIEAKKGAAVVGVEFQDSRSYLGDDDTPLSNSFTNPLDFLQLYGRLESDDILGTGLEGNLTVGRQTLSIGSKRQIERVDFANVIKSYTGAYLKTRNGHGDEFHAFYGVPVGRFPSNRDQLVANVLAADKEQWQRRIWVLHYRHADLLPRIMSGLWGEIFVYGLDESDTDRFQTPNRHYIAPGFRLYRPKNQGAWDLDVEGMWRFGRRRASSAVEDTRDLDVNATMLFAKAGYTFDTPLHLNIAGQYYRTSGDKDPNDGNFDQFERLFGGRRGDLNNTSIFGPLTPANLTAVGARFEIKPSDRFNARLTYSAAYLTSATDIWAIARLSDPSGGSGNFIGHAIDGRFRYWIKPGNLELEIGASALLFGGFASNVMNGPEGSRSLFGYTQLTFFF